MSLGVLIRGRQEGESQRETGRRCAATFKAGQGAAGQRVQVVCRRWKRQGTDSPPAPAEGTSPAHSLISTP